MGGTPRNNIVFRLLTGAQNTFLSGLGAQAFTVSVKEAPLMFCFLCGTQTVPRERLGRFYLPICVRCENTGLAEYYRPGTRPRFHCPWEFGPGISTSRNRTCRYCGREYLTDPLFEDFGFSEAVCEGCLSQSRVNIELSNCCLKPVWRARESERSLAET
ncbi:MAG: hypothetical protein JSW03_05530 [Candidatus Eiseniibacteriota bacterium]|nr:MAG: hypothetical protein JSW03_05530 [Candidatus Eisenbacteria bacterium]